MNNNQQEFSKVSINWYPGHMAKTKRQIAEGLKLVDVVIEILDARMPMASRNPDIAYLVKNKPTILLLNKSDLAEEETTKKWISYFEEKGLKAFQTDSNTGKGIGEVTKELQKRRDENRNLDEKGRVGKSIRTMIVGIPNVGKSSLINRLSKKVSATVGNKPGVTKQKQWVRLGDGIELLDTPGVLWPKLEQEKVAQYLAFTGTIKDEILSNIDIGYELVQFLHKEYPKKLQERYKLEDTFLKELQEADIEKNEKIIAIMEEIGRKRGAIVSGGVVDLEKVANLVLDDFRKGKIGRITLERPEERRK